LEAGATLIGTPTVGACGWSKNIDLPAGVSLRCSLTFPLHGKVPSPLNGIPPHYLVEPTIDDIRSGRDPILEKAKALLLPETKPASEMGQETVDANDAGR